MSSVGLRASAANTVKAWKPPLLKCPEALGEGKRHGEGLWEKWGLVRGPHVSQGNKEVKVTLPVTLPHALFIQNHLASWHHKKAVSILERIRGFWAFFLHCLGHGSLKESGCH